MHFEMYLCWIKIICYYKVPYSTYIIWITVYTQIHIILHIISPLLGNQPFKV